MLLGENLKAFAVGIGMRVKSATEPTAVDLQVDRGVNEMDIFLASRVEDGPDIFGVLQSLKRILLIGSSLLTEAKESL